MGSEEAEKIKGKISEWLVDGGFKVQMSTDEKASFNFLAEDDADRTVNIIQPLSKKEQIIIATKAIISEDPRIKAKLIQINKEKELNFFWELRFALLNSGVGFSPIDMPLPSIQVETQIYYDGLTKDTFMQRLFQIRKALLLIFWTIDRAVGLSEPTAIPDLIV